MIRILSFVTYLLSVVAIHSASAAEMTAEKTDRGVTIKSDGKLFAEYLFRSGTKPILWPIIGPTGQPFTRAYPLENVDGEQRDHIHQRSCWFTHGIVNGVDFWSEPESTANKEAKHGTIAQRELVKAEGGSEAVVVTRNDWLDPEGKKLCEDQRTLTFHVEPDARWIDFDIVLKATAGPVVFGETKEGAFGVRVPTSVSVDGKQGGQIINSNGEANKPAWGKRAKWVDYHGPVAGEQVGIAILNHPTSFRYPTYWHVREYGLFAANPFGERDFTQSGDGTHKLEAGKTLALRYRLLLHKGDEKAGRVAEAYAAYEKLPKQ